jgi:hypothetical protein
MVSHLQRINLSICNIQLHAFDYSIIVLVFVKYRKSQSNLPHPPRETFPRVKTIPMHGGEVQASLLK